MRCWHWVGLLVLGGALAAMFYPARLPAMLPGTRLVVPGAHQLELESKGTYAIFLESRSVMDGRTYLSGGSSELSLSLTVGDSGVELALFTPVTTRTYRTASREGESLVKFEIDRPGSYLLTAAFDGGQRSPQVVLAIGQFRFLSLMLETAGVFLAVVAGGCLAIRWRGKRDALWPQAPDQGRPWWWP